jgi:hypothetical protein
MVSASTTMTGLSISVRREKKGGRERERMEGKGGKGREGGRGGGREGGLPFDTLREGGRFISG